MLCSVRNNTNSNIQYTDVNTGEVRFAAPNEEFLVDDSSERIENLITKGWLSVEESSRGNAEEPNETLNKAGEEE